MQMDPKRQPQESSSLCTAACKAPAQPHTPDCAGLGATQPRLLYSLFALFLKNLVVSAVKMLVEAVLQAAAVILTEVTRAQVVKTFQCFCKINTLEAPVGNCSQPVTLIISHAKRTFKGGACFATSKGRNFLVDMTV